MSPYDVSLLSLDNPPPSANKLQIELWKRILLQRYQQLQELTSKELQFYVNIIKDDEINNEKYATHLVNRQSSSSSTITAVNDVKQHFMALFYCSIDVSVSLEDRKLALDTLQKGFASLDALKKGTISPPQKDQQVVTSSSGGISDKEQTTHHEKDSSKTSSSSKRAREESQLNINASENPSNKQIRRENNNDTTISTTEKQDTNQDKQKQVEKAAIDKQKRSKPEVVVIDLESNNSKRQKIGDTTISSSKSLPQKNTTSPSMKNKSKPMKGESVTDDKKISSSKPIKESKKAVVPLPPPNPNNYNRIITFLPDNNPSTVGSGSIDPRQQCTLSYDAGYSTNGTGASLHNKISIEVTERLVRFDPYYKIIREFGITDVPASKGMTKVSTRTTSCVQMAQYKTANFPSSCAMVSVDLSASTSNSLGVKWGTKENVKTGDRRLILRMLPLKRTEQDCKKRADTHLWPKGTFIQLEKGASQQVLVITQRRQQRHDPNEWKGMSHPVDLTSIIKDARSPFRVKICTREVIEEPETPKHKLGSIVSKEFEDDDGKMKPFAGVVTSYDSEHKLYKIQYEDDDKEELNYKEVLEILVKKNKKTGEDGKLLSGSYAVNLAVCEYTSPDDLFDKLQHDIPKISLKASQEMAKKYLANQTVSIDDSDSDGGNGRRSSGNSSLTFSLLCPMSKVAIETPVRGRNCKHLQCFDFKSYLHSNSHISAGRWRCCVCEEFIPVDSLVRCGLFDEMLKEYKDKVSPGVRDKVSYKSDNTFVLKPEYRLRYGGGKGNDDEEGRIAKQSGKLEVIELLE